MCINMWEIFPHLRCCVWIFPSPLSSVRLWRSEHWCHWRSCSSAEQILFSAPPVPLKCQYPVRHPIADEIKSCPLVCKLRLTIDTEGPLRAGWWVCVSLWPCEVSNAIVKRWPMRLPHVLIRLYISFFLSTYVNVSMLVPVCLLSLCVGLSPLYIFLSLSRFSSLPEQITVQNTYQCDLLCFTLPISKPDSSSEH